MKMWMPDSLCRRTRYVGCLLGSLLFAACSEVTEVTVDDAAVYSADVLADDSEIQSYFHGEERFVELSREFPSFAGFYVEDETLVVLTAEGPDSENIGSAAAITYAAHEAVAGRVAATDVRSVPFSFADLSGWRNAAFQAVIALDDVAILDLDERANKVFVGLETGSQRDQILTALEEAGIPSDAVQVEVVGPNRTSATLLSRVRPLLGGLYTTSIGTTGQTQSCTYGFNAVLNSTDVFITNSHCTRQQFADDVTPVSLYQTLHGYSTTLVGTEYSDPDGWDCTPWYQPWYPDNCRNSDAAAIELVEDSVDFGYIARTASRATGSAQGSKTIDSNAPRFLIEGKDAYPYMGQEVNKMGQASGWTYGDVDRTCFTATFKPSGDDITGGDNDFRVLCAYQADYRSQSGDSGAPVFLWAGGSAGVYLQGLNMGSNDDYGGGAGKGIFSSMSGIEQDLGTLDVTDYVPPLTGVYIAGPYTVQAYSNCTWQVFHSGGVGPFSYSWSGVLSGSTSLPYISGSIGSSGYLNVTVTDSNNQQDSDSFYITVDAQADPCVE
ncbi:MAG: hypothetical protein U5R14_01900 [Gemmatimonadota bacterium]|nr:hypothetical protein [Gemmatimonadota bacterium]